MGNIGRLPLPNGGRSSVGRVPDCGSGCRRFEPGRSPHYSIGSPVNKSTAMNSEPNTIRCPKCSEVIDISRALYRQVENEHRIKLDEGIKQGVEKEKERLKKEVKDEQEIRLNLMTEELNGKNEKIKKLGGVAAQLERLKREKDELNTELKLEAEKKINEEREKIRKEMEDGAELKVKEKEKLIEGLKEQLQEAHRKAAQGSVQLQGEVQELAIEEWLREKFPSDVIEEIKKGASGADCLQTVNTRTGGNCGTIYYESKRTKTFSPKWIEKFKDDILEKKANIGVLVTEVMPKDMERFGLKDGVWICSFDEFKGLCFVLRCSLIQKHDAVITMENKDDKKALAYDFLTGNEFRLRVETIVEGFTQMQKDLESEKRSFKRLWKKREKQIDRVLSNTIEVYGSVQGIAGADVQPVALLELPSDDEGGS